MRPIVGLSRFTIGLISLLASGTASFLAAQQVSVPFVSWRAPGTPLAKAEAWDGGLRDTAFASRRDYRYEGLAVGGIILGGLGAWIGYQISEACPTVPGAECNSDRLGNAVALGLTGAALGGGLGYLVGRFTSKPPLVIWTAADSVASDPESRKNENAKTRSK
jgi:hypothetical protein